MGRGECSVFFSSDSNKQRVHSEVNTSQKSSSSKNLCMDKKTRSRTLLFSYLDSLDPSCSELRILFPDPLNCEKLCMKKWVEETFLKKILWAVAYKKISNCCGKAIPSTPPSHWRRNPPTCYRWLLCKKDLTDILPYVAVSLPLSNMFFVKKIV